MSIVYNNYYFIGSSVDEISELEKLGKTKATYNDAAVGQSNFVAGLTLLGDNSRGTLSWYDHEGFHVGLIGDNLSKENQTKMFNLGWHYSEETNGIGFYGIDVDHPVHWWIFPPE